MMRMRAARVNVKVKTKTVNEDFVTGSLKTIAMMRGVSCELASCTATKSADETKTMNVNIEAAMVPSTAWAVLGLTLDCHAISDSSQ